MDRLLRSSIASTQWSTGNGRCQQTGSVHIDSKRAASDRRIAKAPQRNMRPARILSCRRRASPSRISPPAPAPQQIQQAKSRLLHPMFPEHPLPLLAAPPGSKGVLGNWWAPAPRPGAVERWDTRTPSRHPVQNNNPRILLTRPGCGQRRDHPHAHQPANTSVICLSSFHVRELLLTSPRACGPVGPVLRGMQPCLQKLVHL